MEELQARHRKEQRDLQNRVTQKKKQANKKTRKGVNDECDRLEAELKKKQEIELAALEGEAADNGISSQQLEEPLLAIEGLNNKVVVNGAAQEPEQNANSAALQDGDDELQSQSRKPNRQKARLARRAAEQEEQAKQAAEEAKDLPNLKEQERERMLGYMKARGLHEKEIRADGHCLYSAIADQLEQLDIPIGAAPGDKPAASYMLVRASAADYIEQHHDDFVPFLEEPLSDYLHKIRDTGEWGGQLELLALAKSYDIDINVLQDFGRVETIESGKGDKVIWLGYYMHGFGLGEHYNSLRKAP